MQRILLILGAFFLFCSFCYAGDVSAKDYYRKDDAYVKPPRKLSPDLPSIQSQPKSSSEAPPLSSSDIYTPSTQSEPKSLGDTPIGDSSVYNPAIQSQPKSSSDSSFLSGHKNTVLGQDGSPKPRYISKYKVMKVEEIMYSKDTSFVIIGGDLYGLYSAVGGGEIVDILPGKVIIKFKNKKKTFRVNDVIK